MIYSIVCISIGMSFDKASQHLKLKIPTMHVLKELLFQPSSLSHHDFIPFRRERDHLGRILRQDIQKRSFFSAAKQAKLAKAKRLDRVERDRSRYDDEVGLDSLVPISNSTRQTIAECSFSSKFTKHQYNVTFLSKGKEVANRLRLTKRTEIPQSGLFYESGGYDKFRFRRSPAFKISQTHFRTVRPTAESKTPMEQSKSVRSVAVPTRREEGLHKMRNTGHPMQSQRKQLRIIEDVSEGIRRFQADLERIKKNALRLRNQTMGMNLAKA